MARISALPSQKAALAKLAFVGLQHRLLSSVAAFVRTLKVHRALLLKLASGESSARECQAALAFVGVPDSDATAGWRTPRPMPTRARRPTPPRAPEPSGRPGPRSKSSLPPSAVLKATITLDAKLA